MPIKRERTSNVNTYCEFLNNFSHEEERITENCLYLIDEPENSLAFPMQQALADYIAASARFYGCQFVLATPSPAPLCSFLFEEAMPRRRAEVGKEVFVFVNFLHIY